LLPVQGYGIIGGLQANAASWSVTSVLRLRERRIMDPVRAIVRYTLPDVTPLNGTLAPSWTLAPGALRKRAAI